MQHNKPISIDTLIYYCRLYNFLAKHDMPRHVANLTEEQEAYLDLLEYLVSLTTRELSFHDFVALLDTCAELHPRRDWLNKAYRRNLRKWEGR